MTESTAGRSDVRRALLGYMTTLALPADSDRALLDEFEREMNACPPPVAEIRERVPIAEVEGWRLSADIVVPPGEILAGLVWLHGGGWTTGSPASFRRLGCEFASRGMLTFLIDYRRAPKHRFPAALDDSITGFQWATEQIARYGLPRSHLLLGGDSAGANLAAAAALSVETQPPGLVLAYGIFDYHDALPLLKSSVDAPTAEGQHYLPVSRFESLRDDPQVSPIRAAGSLPPALLVIGGQDPLRPQTGDLAFALREAGVAHEELLFESAPHAFLQLPFLDVHDRAYEQIVIRIKQMVG